MPKSIEVIIHVDGSVTIDAKGFSGGECVKATEYLEEALGKVTKRNKKPEYNQVAKVGQKQKAGL